MVMLIKYTLTKVNNEIGAKSSLGRKACSYVGMLGARRPRARGGAERAGGVAHPAGTGTTRRLFTQQLSQNSPLGITVLNNYCNVPFYFYARVAVRVRAHLPLITVIIYYA